MLQWGAQGRLPERRVTSRSKEEIAQAVASALTDALECKCEGILLKSLDSTYACGEESRSRKAWVKVKPDYVDAAGEPLDLLILCGYYGDGRRRGNISHFLLGVAERPGMSAADHQFKVSRAAAA
jgi:DNA ligase-4